MEGIPAAARAAANDGRGAVRGQIFWAEVCRLGLVVSFPSFLCPFPSAAKPRFPSMPGGTGLWRKNPTRLLCDS